MRLRHPHAVQGSLILAVATLGAGAGAVPAMAQTQEPQKAASSDQATIADIVVTAERRPQTVQKTPIAITAIDGASLVKSGISDLNNAIDRTPAVQVQKSNVGSTFYIRGIGSRGQSGSSPVSVFQDGIYQEQPEMMGVGFADIARIEVLRGPQGTIYGRNANGGTVNMITNDPKLGEYSGAVTAQVGNYDTIRLQGVVNLPLTDTLALRVVAAANKHDGYLSNGLNDQDEKLGRAKLLWKPTDALKVELSVERTQMDAKGAGNVLLPTSSRGDAWEGQDYSTLYTIPGGEAVACSPTCSAYFRLTNMAYRGEISYDLGFATATFLTGVQRFDRSYGQPFSGLWETDRLPVHQETYEFRLNSPASSPIQWVMGAYMFDIDRAGEVKNNYTFGQLTNYAVNDAHSRAVFGQATVPVNDRLRLTGGLRYTHDNFHRRDDSGVIDGTTGEVTTAPVQGTLQTGKYGRVTYKAGVEYDLAPRSMLYAQHSTGFRSGGVDPSGGLYDPETIKAFEIGSKNRLFGNTLQLNAAAYYYLYDGYQLSYYLYQNGSSVPSFVTSNVPGTTKIWGAEIEGQVSLTARDHIDFSANYQRSKFGQAKVATSCDSSGTCDIADLTGRSLPRTPTWTFGGAYEHRFEFASKATLVPHVDVQYKSAYNVDILTFNYSRQNASALLNGRITFTSPDEAWSLGAYINNVTNRAIIQQANTAGPAVYGIINDPRTFGAVLNAKF